MESSGERAKLILPARFTAVTAVIAAVAIIMAFLVTSPASPVAAGEVSLRDSSVRADWSSLQSQRGVAILYRHAVAPGGGDPAGFDVRDCSTQRNLSRAGLRQASRMGRELRERAIRIAAVYTSPWCRARDTATAMRVGPVRELRRLGSVFQASQSTALRRERATTRLLARHAERQGVAILVFHQANIIDLTGIAPASGEGVVVTFDKATNSIEVLGSIPAPTVIN